MSALTATVLMVGIVTSVVAHSHTPHVRRPTYEPRRLPWDEHKADLEERDCFRRYYRMDMQSFHKLAELLRPLLEVNAHYAGECLCRRLPFASAYTCTAVPAAGLMHNQLNAHTRLTASVLKSLVLYTGKIYRYFYCAI